MANKRQQSKAMRELEDTKILVDYLLHHNLSFDVLDNFSDRMIKIAREWHDGRESYDF